MMLETMAVVYFDVTFYSALVFVYGFLILKAPLASNINYLLLILVIILAVAAVLSTSLISASMFFLLNAKEGIEPVSWIISMLTPFLSGVYYPPEILPKALQYIAWLLPQTHGLAAIREVALKGATLMEISDHVIFLILYTLFFTIIGYLLYKYSLKRALKTGDLPHW